MTTTKRVARVVSYPVLTLGLMLPWMMHCGAGQGMPAGIPGGDNLPKPPADLAQAAGCPDLSSASAIASASFEKDFGVEADSAARLRKGLEASVEVRGFADKVDADLKAACTDLAKDLGATGDHKDGEEACKAAIKAMGAAKAKIGGSARFTMDVKPPRCEASMNAMADCAAKCDARIKPGEAKVECEPGKLSGTCDAKCEGECDLKASAKCDGTCSGSCSATMKGSCSGKCDGTCDGKPSKGAVCTGTCDGKCDAHVEGTCGGECKGSCKLKAAAKCDGTCTGKCSAEFKEPKCTGAVKPPEMSADCKAKCNTEITAKAECTPASVGMRVEGAADLKAAEQYKMAIEKNLPAVLKIAIGLKDQSAQVAGEIETTAKELEAGAKGMAKGGAAAGARLAACVSAPLTAAVKGAAALRADVNVSVEVKASASASASGSASGKAAAQR